MNHLRLHLYWPALLLTAAGPHVIASAQTAPTTATQAPTALGRVVVDGQPGAGSLAAAGNAEILPREVLSRFGATTLGDALSRAGAVVMVTNRSGSQEITLAGLGDGYTQILLNGAKAPRGFSLDTLPVESIERVEIIRSASPEIGARGIAGTINIIQRRTTQGKSGTTLKAAATGGWSRGFSSDVSTSEAGPWTGSTIGLQASYRYSESDRSSTAWQAETSGGDTRYHLENARGNASARDLNLAPRLDWKSGGRSLSLDTLFQDSRQRRGTDYFRTPTELSGEPLSPTITEESSILSRINRQVQGGSVSARGTAMGGAVIFDGKIGGTASRRVSTGRIQSLPSDGNTAAVSLHYPSRDLTLNARFKAEFDLLDFGSMDLGVQKDQLRRREEDLIDGISPLEARFRIQSKDDAVYGRWTGKLAGENDVQFGLRHEQIGFGYSENDQPEIWRYFTYLIPQASLKRNIAGINGSISLSATRSLRLPSESEFSNRTYLTAFNGPTSPFQRGNPNLRPEIGNSLELAVSGKTETASGRMSVSYKQLEHTIGRELLLDRGIWVARPINNGDGQLALLDAQLKSRPIRQANGVQFSLGATFTLAHSRITLTDGSSSRLPNNAPFQAGVTWDGTLSEQCSVGGALNVRSPYAYRDAGNVLVRQSTRRSADLYAAYRLDKQIVLRGTLLNVGQRSQARYFSQSTDQQMYVEESRAKDGLSARLSLEASFK